MRRGYVLQVYTLEEGEDMRYKGEDDKRSEKERLDVRRKVESKRTIRSETTIRSEKIIEKERNPLEVKRPFETQPIRMEMFPFEHCPKGNGDVSLVCFIRENNDCPPCVFESAQCSFDVALRSSLERIVTASGPGFGDWQWRLATLPFKFGGFGVYCAGDVLNYAFLASRLQSAGLQTKLLRHTDIVSPGPIFNDALSVFNISMETDLLCNPSEIAAPKLMKKMTDIYFTRVTKNTESTFSLSPRQMAMWTSQREDHTSDWLRTVPIYGLGQTMNGIFMETMLYRVLGLLLARKLISGWMGRDKSLRPANMLLYSWDGGVDVCVDLTRSSPLTQTGMVDFVPGRAVIDAAQRKRGDSGNSSGKRLVISMVVEARLSEKEEV
ncbi:hypothetical protein Tco_0718752 [Tanacetum coccineum]